MERLDEDTLILVLSDHGFGPFRRAFDTNSWLWAQGLLAFRAGHRPDMESSSGFEAVDWSHTYAYAVGLGGIYLNLRGREAGGILQEGSEAERVRNAIETKLPTVVDPLRQEVAVASVSRRENLYSGAYSSEAPDLLVNFSSGFRVSWASAMGGFAAALFADNQRLWSGDHLVDPAAVPGIFFMNRPCRRDLVRMVDGAATILSFLNVPQHSAMEGVSLL
jgi:predicted AlkP superfamily phosphohydrolase/phosphomutase